MKIKNYKIKIVQKTYTLFMMRQKCTDVKHQAYLIWNEEYECMWIYCIHFYKSNLNSWFEMGIKNANACAYIALACH